MNYVLAPASATNADGTHGARPTKAPAEDHHSMQRVFAAKDGCCCRLKRLFLQLQRLS